MERAGTSVVVVGTISVARIKRSKEIKLRIITPCLRVVRGDTPKLSLLLLKVINKWKSEILFRQRLDWLLARIKITLLR